MYFPSTSIPASWTPTVLPIFHSDLLAFLSSSQLLLPLFQSSQQVEDLSLPFHCSSFSLYLFHLMELAPRSSCLSFLLLNSSRPSRSCPPPTSLFPPSSQLLLLYLSHDAFCSFSRAGANILPVSFAFIQHRATTIGATPPQSIMM